MYGREELESHLTHINCSFFKCYLAGKADKVMNSMEARIKELEERAVVAEKRTEKILRNYEYAQSTIKELELALSNSREHEKALRKCFDNHRKRIKELEEELKHKDIALANYRNNGGNNG